MIHFIEKQPFESNLVDMHKACTKKYDYHMQQNFLSVLQNLLVFLFANAKNLLVFDFLVEGSISLGETRFDPKNVLFIFLGLRVCPVLVSTNEKGSSESLLPKLLASNALSKLYSLLDVEGRSFWLLAPPVSLSLALNFFLAAAEFECLLRACMLSFFSFSR